MGRVMAQALPELRNFRTNSSIGLFYIVMAGLVPAIHVFLCHERCKTWMAGTSPGMTTS
jgi:hypothetical protein